MKRVILPCNGLDKQYGVLARELALKLADNQDNEIICPVLLNNSPARYERNLTDAALLVIDGCSTRCASKLCNKLGLKIDDKILVSEQAKNAETDVGKSLLPEATGMQLVDIMETGLRSKADAVINEESALEFPYPTDFINVTHGKFIFKIPKQNYFFNENDCWVQVVGNRARVGVSDFVQQNMTDITYFEPAEANKAIEQFDEIGSIESSKSMMDVLSPVSGKIAAVNTQLVDFPELVNEDPYGKGWIAEIELQNFDEDKKLLLNAESYSKIVEKKAAEE